MRAQTRLGSMLGVISLAILTVSCGKAEENGPQVLHRAGFVSLDKLEGTRLQGAGCIDVVKANQGRLIARFYSLKCDSEQAPRFSLDLDPDTGVLSRNTFPVGEVVFVESRPNGDRHWRLVHLCQISDPAARNQTLYGEVCTLEFEEAAGAPARISRLSVRRVDDLVREKSELEAHLTGQLLGDRRQLRALEDRHAELKKEFERVQTELGESRASLGEVQRGLSEALASKLKLTQELERVQAQLEWREAEHALAVLELRLMYAQNDAQNEAGESDDDALKDADIESLEMQIQAQKELAQKKKSRWEHLRTQGAPSLLEQSRVVQ